MSDDFVVGKKRRAIEDRIIKQFYTIDFKQAQHAYLEESKFEDFVFSWYDLVKYYEDSEDTAIGANMVELYQACHQIFQIAAQDVSIRERRRDKANDALYQISYYFNRMILQAERNGIEKEEHNPTGKINWKKPPPDSSHMN